MFRIFFTAIALLLATNVSAEDCVTCHEKATPGAVSDWKLSAHFAEDVTCDDCHGDGHSSANDLEKVLTVTPETCAGCHQDRFDQYKAGKHALAWAALKSMKARSAIINAAVFGAFSNSAIRAAARNTLPLIRGVRTHSPST